MAKEVWKKIPKYKSYEVSNLGRVRSVSRWVGACASHKSCAYESFRLGKVLKPGRNTKFGHVTVSLGRRNSINVHRLVLLAFVGPCPKGKEVLHKNGIASDNRLVNLRYGTRSENNIDISKMGRRKLNEKKVKEIKKANPTEWNALRLSKRFKVARSTIYQVWHGNNWAWVK